ncbi:MAG: patatin-like phospholipase family protein [Desulfuromonadales bacterium]|nr:patatin-like phospholipase family protein [Desulfuromonadales bacterium]
MPEERSRTALVLAGGGIMGAAYEIGCLSAIDRLFTPGFNTRSFDTFIGISAGSVIATLLASRIPPALLYRVLARDELRVFNWRRSDIYRFDLREVLVSGRHTVRNLYRIFRHYRRNRWKLSFGDFLHILQEQFPAGLYSLGPMENYLCRAFREEKIVDDFHSLGGKLLIPAYDLDAGERVVFGSEGFRDVHICQAITASCAIPYFFRPHKVAGRYYLDGSIGRVTHLDLAIERGARLILVINPRVPVHNDPEHFCLPSMSYGQCSTIADLGITFAWEQAQRIESKEKLNLTLENYRRTHPHVEIVLIEPGREEALLFLPGAMSNEARHQILSYGYNLTLSQLRDRFEELSSIFGRHGIELTERRLHLEPPADKDP